MTRTLSTESVYKHYCSSTPNVVPAPNSLFEGEIAVNFADKKLWVGDASGDPVELDFKQVPRYALPSAGKVLTVNSTGTDVEWTSLVTPGVQHGEPLDVTKDPAGLPLITEITVYPVATDGITNHKYPDIGDTNVTDKDFLLRTPSDHWIIFSDLVNLRKDVDTVFKANSKGFLENDGKGVVSWHDPGTDKIGQLTNDGTGKLSWADNTQYALPEYRLDKEYKQNQFVAFEGEMYKCISSTGTAPNQDPKHEKTLWKKIVTNGSHTFVQDTQPTPFAEGDQWFDTNTKTGGSSYIAVNQVTASGTDLLRWVDSDGRGDIADITDVGVKNWKESSRYKAGEVIVYKGKIYTVLADTVIKQSPETDSNLFETFKADAGKQSVVPVDPTAKLAFRTPRANTLFIAEKTGKIDPSFGSLAHHDVKAGDRLEYDGAEWHIVGLADGDNIYHGTLDPSTDTGKVGDLYIKRKTTDTSGSITIKAGITSVAGNLAGSISLKDADAASIAAANGHVTVNGVSMDLGVVARTTMFDGFAAMMLGAHADPLALNAYMGDGPDWTNFAAVLGHPSHPLDKDLIIKAGVPQTDNSIWIKQTDNTWEEIFSVAEGTAETRFKNLSLENAGGVPVSEGVLRSRGGKIEWYKQKSQVIVPNIIVDAAQITRDNTAALTADKAIFDVAEFMEPKNKGAYIFTTHTESAGKPDEYVTLYAFINGGNPAPDSHELLKSYTHQQDTILPVVPDTRYNNNDIVSSEGHLYRCLTNWVLAKPNNKHDPAWTNFWEKITGYEPSLKAVGTIDLTVPLTVLFTRSTIAGDFYIVGKSGKVDTSWYSQFNSDPEVPRSVKAGDMILVADMRFHHVAHNVGEAMTGAVLLAPTGQQAMIVAKAGGYKALSIGIGTTEHAYITGNGSIIAATNKFTVGPEGNLKAAGPKISFPNLPAGGGTGKDALRNVSLNYAGDLVLGSANHSNSPTNSTALPIYADKYTGTNIVQGVDITLNSSVSTGGVEGIAIADKHADSKHSSFYSFIRGADFAQANFFKCFGDGFEVFTVKGDGEIKSDKLKGTGARMVVADEHGVLGTQAIPSGTGGAGSVSTSKSVLLSPSADQVITPTGTGAEGTITLGMDSSIHTTGKGRFDGTVGIGVGASSTRGLLVVPDFSTSTSRYGWGAMVGWDKLGTARTSRRYGLHINNSGSGGTNSYGTSLNYGALIAADHLAASPYAALHLDAKGGTEGATTQYFINTTDGGNPPFYVRTNGNLYAAGDMHISSSDIVGTGFNVAADGRIAVGSGVQPNVQQYNLSATGITTTGMFSQQGDTSHTLTGNSIDGVVTASYLGSVGGVPTTPAWDCFLFRGKYGVGDTFTVKGDGSLMAAVNKFNVVGDTGQTSIGTGASTSYFVKVVNGTVIGADRGIMYAEANHTGISGYTGKGAVVVAQFNTSVTDAATANLFSGNANNTNVFSVKGDGSLTAAGTKINFANLPTSAAGLATGDLWRDGELLKIVP